MIIKRYLYETTYHTISVEDARAEIEPVYLEATPEIMGQILRGYTVFSEVAEYRAESTPAGEVAP